MAERPKFQQQQYAFAAHIRDPQNAPAPGQDAMTDPMGYGVPQQPQRPAEPGPRQEFAKHFHGRWTVPTVRFRSRAPLEAVAHETGERVNHYGVDVSAVTGTLDHGLEHGTLVIRR